jgi:hypothetical protein
MQNSGFRSQEKDPSSPVHCRHSAIENRRWGEHELPSHERNQPKQKRQHHTHHEASDNRKVNCRVFSLVCDIAGKPAEPPEIELSACHQQESCRHHHDADNDQELPDLNRDVRVQGSTLRAGYNHLGATASGCQACQRGRPIKASSEGTRCRPEGRRYTRSMPGKK